jgi:hypothetical protein
LTRIGARFTSRGHGPLSYRRNLTYYQPKEQWVFVPSEGGVETSCVTVSLGKRKNSAVRIVVGGGKPFACNAGSDPMLQEGGIYQFEVLPLNLSMLVCVSNGELDAFGKQKFWILYRDAGLSDFVFDLRQLTGNSGEIRGRP